MQGNSADQPLLSELCSICNNKKPNYRCPRCATRTCSLPCYKRHQQWAQCSGQRDPTAYVKRSQLATPAGIDHDYNFLTGIERAFDKADHEVEERGISTRNDRAKAPARGSNYEKHLESTRVIIERAPTGMSRQKQNNTRWNQKKKCIVWTVEWIHEDQSRDVSELRESKPLAEGYAEVLSSKLKKRKRNSESDLSGDKQQPSGPGTGQGPSVTAKPVADPAEADSGQVPASDNSSGHPALNAVATDLPQAAAVVSDEAQPSQVGPTSAEPSVEVDTSVPAASTSPTSVEPPEAQYHFYLVKPHTTSSRCVLIPLSPSESLSKCLRDQVVLEFPTIQVLSQPPSSLPEGFMLEHAYLHQSKQEAAELGGLLSTVNLPGEYGEQDRNVGDGDEKRMLDDWKILEVLQQDLGDGV